MWRNGGNGVMRKRISLAGSRSIWRSLMHGYISISWQPNGGS